MFDTSGEHVSPPYKLIGLLGFKFGGDGKKLVCVALPYVVSMMHLCMGYSSTKGGSDGLELGAGYTVLNPIKLAIE